MNPIQFLYGAEVQIRSTCISCGGQLSMTTGAIYCVDCAEPEVVAPDDKDEDSADSIEFDVPSVDELTEEQ